MKIREFSFIAAADAPLATIRIGLAIGTVAIALPTNGIAVDGGIDIEAAVLIQGLEAAISDLAAWAAS